MAWLLAVLVAAVFGAAFFALGPLIRRLVLREAVREYQEPLPEAWITGVVDKVAAVRALSDEQRERLLRAARDLVTSCRWEGAGGLTLTRDMQLVIAAQACLLTLEMPGDAYPNLRTVLVYPTSFFASRAPDLRKWSGTSVPEPPLHELGEAWSNGTVVIAWEAAMLGGADAADGHNVVIHEFAHLIDFQLQITPALNRPLQDGVRSAGWTRVLTDGQEQLAQTVSLAIPSVLDSYGTTNLAEFFAVATEAFFERPAELRAEYGAVYRQLSGLYRQNPAGSPD